MGSSTARQPLSLLFTFRNLVVMQVAKSKVGVHRRRRLVPHFRISNALVIFKLHYRGYCYAICFRYVIGGQLCVSKRVRGQSLASRIMVRQALALAECGYSCTVTEIASENTASIRAHEKAGYGIVERQETPGPRAAKESWVVVCQDHSTVCTTDSI